MTSDTDTLVAQLRNSGWYLAAPSADRIEALEAEVARLTAERDSFVLEADALNEEKTILTA